MKLSNYVPPKKKTGAKPNDAANIGPMSPQPGLTGGNGRPPRSPVDDWPLIDADVHPKKS
jgi:hypothetical protein